MHSPVSFKIWLNCQMDSTIHPHLYMKHWIMIISTKITSHLKTPLHFLLNSIMHLIGHPFMQAHVYHKTVSVPDVVADGVLVS